MLTSSQACPTALFEAYPCFLAFVSRHRQAPDPPPLTRRTEILYGTALADQWLVQMAPSYAVAALHQVLWCGAFRDWAINKLWIPASLLTLAAVGLFSAHGTLTRALSVPGPLPKAALQQSPLLSRPHPQLHPLPKPAPCRGDASAGLPGHIPALRQAP